MNHDTLLGIGVIGAGGRGWLSKFAHDPAIGSRIVAACDTNPAPLAKHREAYGDGLFVTDDYRALLARPEVDAVFVTSPDFLHEEHATAALAAGKVVYLEKPMAITVEGCDRILRTARRTGSKLYLGHNMRHFPVILKMKEIIDSGQIGTVEAAWCRHFVGYGGDAYFRDWHSEAKNTTGLLLQKAAHDIDVMHWLAGGYTRTVVGMGKLSVYNRCARRRPDEAGCARWDASQWPPLEQTGLSPKMDVEDHSMILMQMDNGVQGAYLQCHYTPDAERNYTFIGTRGRVENVGDSDKCEVHVWTRRGPRATPDIVYHLKPASGSHGGSDPLIIGNFLAFVRHGAATNASPTAARDAVAAGVLGHKSMRNGSTPYDIPPLDPELVRYFADGQRR